MSDKDRTTICNIISDMLDNPDEHGLYPTSTAFTRLELYIESVRAEAVGWTHTNACVALDQGDDPRIQIIPEILERAQVDLANPKIDFKLQDIEAPNRRVGNG